ncbi:GNAT family N-acetyltransferase [Dellaglioa carnosa]|uniref:GNAT family N-acetyltransferase n=1 Tax=Dellaglioa carnosa TaxID=2995136 RepID=A0ABT4JLZ3_9LACO|nr:GNAT family N-acetyltransferase [Dellaglioa carnosa]MCZ2491379.1 GNAT family N-acetyltransferase [Dellaglioa carnosa]MCZ2494457.1 GNAT family N-acetyltransferase [Dellaglioa carnosa]MDK1731127.1 GNAT family N-acetyltransferase [Dellaglioa carnosa]
MFTVKSTRDLDGQIYKDALTIRKIVFVGEQNVPIELEIENEAEAIHFVGYKDDKPVVTARTIVEDSETWHIQRVATIKDARGQHLATDILMFIEGFATVYDIKYLTLGAQDQAQNFYKKLGYEIEGEGFMDAGIPHHTMVKTIEGA